MSKISCAFLALTCTVAVVAVGCASSPPVVRGWLDPVVTIDGAYADWGGRFERIAGKRNVGLSVAKGERDLFLCIVTRDLGVQSLLQSAGFTLWLDPGGGQNEKLGLRVAPQETEGEEAVTPKVEVVFDGAEYGYQLATPGPEAPVDVKSARYADVLVYEFRITRAGPVVKSGRDAAATLSLGPKLGVGVLTETLPPPEAAPGQSRRRVRTPKPLKLWSVAVLEG